MKKAVGIVLLPSDDVITKVIDLSKQAYEANESPTILGATDRIPHISLLMGVLGESNLEKVKAVLNKIAADTAPLTLSISAEKPSWLVIERSSELMTLHERLISELNPLLSHDPTAEMFDEDSPRDIVEGVYPWIRDFIPDYSHGNFEPHITTFSNESFGKPLPYSFQSSRLGLCHLGNYNTCRTILAEETLQ